MISQRVAPAEGEREITYRHRVPTRLWHWLNVVALAVLLMSGLQIFNAHPALYWGQAGSELDQPILDIGSTGSGAALRGVTTLAGIDVDTTGVLGVSTNSQGAVVPIAFPGWATLPANRDLASARHWHFFFAWVFGVNLLLFALVSFFNGHVREVWPGWRELRPRHLVHEIWQHMRLKFPKGAAAKNYNVIQKLAYASVIFVALPLMIFTGLTMSPGINAAAPWMLDVMGGRQSARTIHFICANFLLLFLIVHLVMLGAVGVWNELRSMITGRYVIKHEKAVQP